MYYFAYGSNLNQVQMAQRCPTAAVAEKAVLKDHQLAFTIYAPHRQCGAADIVKNNGSEVWGLLYVVTPADLHMLDRIECHPDKYRRIQITVAMVDNTVVTAATYEVATKSASPIMPSKDYLEKMRRAAAIYHFPQTYQEYLAKIETCD